MISRYQFRLRSAAAQADAPSITFWASRADFRTALADAMIAMRCEPQTTPLVLEINVPTRPHWKADAQEPADTQRVRRLPEVLRWESVVENFDRLARLLYAEPDPVQSRSKAAAAR